MMLKADKGNHVNDDKSEGINRQIKVILQIKLLSCIPPKQTFYTLVFTQYHDCRSNLW